MNIIETAKEISVLTDRIKYLENKIERMGRANFKVGDFVQLKLGGPKMVIENITLACGQWDYCFCKWMNKNDELASGGFPPILLKHLQRSNNE